MTESSAQDRSGQDRISAPLALHEEDAITNSTRDASQSANDQDQSPKVGQCSSIHTFRSQLLPKRVSKAAKRETLFGDDALIQFLVGTGTTRRVHVPVARALLHHALVLHQLLVVLVVNLLRFHRGLESLPGLHDALIDACAVVLELVRGLNLGANSQ